MTEEQPNPSPRDDEAPKEALVCVYSGGAIVDRVKAEVCGRTITLEKPLGIVDGNTCWILTA